MSKIDRKSQKFDAKTRATKRPSKLLDAKLVGWLAKIIVDSAG